MKPAQRRRTESQRSTPAMHWMHLLAAMTIVISALIRSAPAQTTIAASDLTDEHVRKAIDCLVQALHERKQPGRFWELDKVPANESTRQGGGYTALSLLALLYAGQSYQDERLRDAVEHLEKLELQGTYAMTVRTSVWAKLPPRFDSLLAADVQWLLAGFNPHVGGWDYVQNPTTKYHDNSIRQFGALALWEAAKRGVKIDRRVWMQLEETFIKLQRPDGGWSYKEDLPSTGSMTAAGLATLFITQDLLHANEAVKLPVGRTAPAATTYERAIERGMKWMDAHFSAAENPGKDMYFYYYLYGVERVGLASGYKYFGGRDWYREGAAEIIRRLCKWDRSSESFALKSTAEARSMTDEIAFGLMFLSRGRVPVALNKLQFEGAWNNRPRDAANLTSWISQNSESDLSWQIVNITSEPETWLDAPILYIASHTALPWLKDVTIDAQQYAAEAREFIRLRSTGELPVDAKPPAAPEIPELIKLKRYLDLGGLLLGINEGGSKQFADSIVRAGTLMYPQYEWRDLPDDHWAYELHTQVKGRRIPLRGLSNGVRELIILCAAGDASAILQKADTRQHGEYHTLGNIYYYASEMNQPRPRLAQHYQSTSAATSGPDAITIVRALHQGNWKPEPQALNVFASVMAAQRKLSIAVADAPLESIDQLSPAPALVVVSGVEAMEFTEKQVAAITNYVRAGGVLLFETAGGVGQFARSAEQMCQRAFNKEIEAALRTPVITGEGMSNSVNLAQVEYRLYSMKVFGTRETAPRLRYITIDADRPQVFFSHEDISNALLDQPCWGISGYSPHAARNLLGNIVQHAAKK